jgi:hypothetical protein
LECLKYEDHDLQPKKHLMKPRLCGRLGWAKYNRL